MFLGQLLISKEKTSLFLWQYQSISAPLDKQSSYKTPNQLQNAYQELRQDNMGLNQNGPRLFIYIMYNPAFAFLNSPYYFDINPTLK